MVYVLLNNLDSFFIENTFKNNTINLWLAPGQGLLLDEITFDRYNRKNGLPEKLVLSPEARNLKKLNKSNIIYKEIMSIQKESDIFENWLKAESKEGEDDDICPLEANDGDC